MKIGPMISFPKVTAAPVGRGSNT
jgi:hypothetical protein